MYFEKKLPISKLSLFHLTEFIFIYFILCRLFFLLYISVNSQQHGSVYWRTGAENVLQHLDPSHTLVDQLSANSSVFSIKDSPIWMDSSTTKECKMLEAAVGGPQKIAALTGSRYIYIYVKYQLISFVNDSIFI